MSKPEFTKGPWTTEPPSGMAHPRVYSQSKDKLIAEVGNSENSLSALNEHEANARLIAAAPELHDDGRFLIERLEELEIPDELARDWMGHVEPAIARFKIALSKARGEQ